MLRNADYILNNCVISDEINSTKKYCKKAQVGVDLTVRNIYIFTENGEVNNTKTELPKYSFLKPLKNQWFLKKGTYIIELNEGISLGKNDTGLIIMRSSLNRCGVSIQSAVWDPGYTTKNGAIISTMSVRLTVDNPYGFSLERNSRICQLLIFENENTDLYNGQWQGGKNGL